MEGISKLFKVSVFPFGSWAILCIQLSFLALNSHGMVKLNLTEVPTASPDDVERVWPDLSCHSPTFQKEAVKEQMDACLGKPHNRPHFSICQLTCTMKSLKVLKIANDNKTLMSESPSAKKAMMTIVNDGAVAQKLLKSMSDLCSEIYIEFTYEERVDSSEEDVKRPRPCEEWGPFLACINEALKCAEAEAK